MKNTTKQRKLWVYSAAAILSFNGGYVSSISLVSILKNPVGYVTGNLTQAGELFEKGEYGLFLHLFTLVFCFLLGSMLSGLIIKDQCFKIDYRYDFSLLLQLGGVIASMVLLFLGFHQAGYLLAAVMGMQNAMTTHYGSALIRTTHMTGTTTDLGILLSYWIKGRKVEFWKMRLYGFLIIGFSAGAIAGALCYSILHAFALSMCALCYIFMLVLGGFSRDA